MPQLSDSPNVHGRGRPFVESSSNGCPLGHTLVNTEIHSHTHTHKKRAAMPQKSQQNEYAVNSTYTHTWTRFFAVFKIKKRILISVSAFVGELNAATINRIEIPTN